MEGIKATYSLVDDVKKVLLHGGDEADSLLDAFVDHVKQSARKISGLEAEKNNLLTTLVEQTKIMNSHVVYEENLAEQLDIEQSRG